MIEIPFIYIATIGHTLAILFIGALLTIALMGPIMDGADSDKPSFWYWLIGGYTCITTIFGLFYLSQIGIVVFV